RNCFDPGHRQHGTVTQVRLAWSKTEPAVPNDNGGHPMPAGHGAIRIPVDLRIVMRMQIDEPRRNNEPMCIERFLGVARFELADLGNFALFNPDISETAGRAGTINNRSTLDDYIEFRHGCSSLRIERSLSGCSVPCHSSGAPVNSNLQLLERKDDAEDSFVAAVPWPPKALTNRPRTWIVRPNSLMTCERADRAHHSQWHAEW